jgi:EAL domain-containing protein (putative c-di-GMP-specific phosphodiesterase class I)/CheY-like chemotaxis protein
MSEGTILGSTQPIRVLIAEDDPGARQALADLLSGDDHFLVIGQAGNAKEAATLASLFHPDVALLDVRMPFGGGPKAAREIRERSPGTRVLALSMLDDRSAVLEMIRAGAVGYLMKTEPPSIIIDAIQSSARGDGALSERAAAKVVHELAGQLRREERRSQERRVRVQRVRHLITGAGLVIAFQPIFELESRRVLGLEALARFPGRARRSPSTWLAEAETVGLRIDLELTALRATLGRLGELPAHSFLSINLSPETATVPSLPGLLERMPVDRLVVEITEQAPIEDYEPLKEAMGPLRRRGLRLAIDDAGAGFASLRHIVRLEPDFIKLDIALTRDIESDRSQRAMAAALIAFGAETGAAIIAEGIETRAQLDTLRGLGIELGQGYYLAPPSATVAPALAGPTRAIV